MNLPNSCHMSSRERVSWLTQSVLYSMSGRRQDAYTLMEALPCEPGEEEEEVEEEEEDRIEAGSLGVKE